MAGRLGCSRGGAVISSLIKVLSPLPGHENLHTNTWHGSWASPRLQMGQADPAQRLGLGSVIKDGDSAEEVTANQAFLLSLPGEMVLPATWHFVSCSNYTQIIIKTKVTSLNTALHSGLSVTTKKFTFLLCFNLSCPKFISKQFFVSSNYNLSSWNYCATLSFFCCCFL